MQPVRVIGSISLFSRASWTTTHCRVIDGVTPVTVTLPFSSAKTVTLYRMAGNPRSHNLDDEQVRIETIKLTPRISNSQFSVEGGIPPGATLLYVFEGI
jgi:hypothetical protein